MDDGGKLKDWWQDFKAKRAFNKSNRQYAKDYDKKFGPDKVQLESNPMDKASGVLSGVTQGIAAAQIDPSKAPTREMAGKMADEKTMALASAGATAGAAFGPIGAAVGFVGGAAIGSSQKIGAQEEFDDKENEKVVGEWSNADADLMKSFYSRNDSQRMENQIGLLNKQRGIVNS